MSQKIYIIVAVFFFLIYDGKPVILLVQNNLAAAKLWVRKAA